MYPILTSSTGKVIISSGMAVIVADYYGNGRSVLIGPHPELDPKSPGIIVNLIVWAANKPPLSGVTPPIDEIIPPDTTPIPPAADAATINTSDNTLTMQNTGTPVYSISYSNPNNNRRINNRQEKKIKLFSINLK